MSFCYGWCTSHEKCCLQQSGPVEYSSLCEPAVHQRSVGVTGAVGLKSGGERRLCVECGSLHCIND